MKKHWKDIVYFLVIAVLAFLIWCLFSCGAPEEPVREGLPESVLEELKGKGEPVPEEPSEQLPEISEKEPTLPEISEAEAPPPDYELDNVPQGAVFDPETQTFSWQTQPGDAGIYPGVKFSVTDGIHTVSEVITIIVLSANRPPDLDPIPLKVAIVNEVITFTLQASDPDGDELIFFAKNLPPGAQFSPPSFSWVPTEIGVWPAITFGVTDGEDKVTRKVIIAVKAVN